MKRIGLILFFTMLGFNTFSQVLFQSSTEQRATEQEVEEWLEERFKDDEAFISYQFIDVNLNSLEFDSVEVDLFDNKFKVKESNKDIRGLQNFSWYGISVSEEGENTVLFSTLNDDMQGVVRTREKVIAIETYNDDYIAIELDPKNFPECGMETTGNEDDDNPTDKDNNSGNKGHSPSSNSYSTSTIKSTNDFSCKIRVLVAYTPSAASNISNIQNHAQLCIFQMNQGLSNSNLDYIQVELATVHLTPYLESSEPYVCNENDGNDDLSRFVNNGDGFMDEVHELREEFSADICVLMSNIHSSISYVGVARSIKSTPENAFCLSHYFYSFTNMTFDHEIGHLLGCRHDINADPNINPYAFGHGFIFSMDVNPNFQGRTIMATGGSCNFCPRNLIWSSSTLSTPGSSIMGDANDADNARVIEETFENVMSHRPNTGLLIASQNRINNANQASGYLYHANQIQSDENGTTVSSTQNVSFIAGNRIELRNFSTEQGAKFEAMIVSPCGESDGLPSDYCADDPNFGADDSKMLLSSSDYFSKNKITKPYNLTAFPNPNDGDFQLSFSNPVRLKNINITLYNYIGHKVKEIFNGPKSQGSHDIHIALENVSTGIYFIVFNIGGEKVVSEKIVIIE